MILHLQRPFRIKAVLFDFDGTLTQPGAIDFSIIRKAIGCPENQPIIEFIEAIPDRNLQQKYFLYLEQFEMEGAEKSMPNPDAETAIQYLRSAKLYTGIISRNGMLSIKRAFENFGKPGMEDFDLIITRDDPIAPKPSDDGINLAADRFKIKPEEILVVGDYIYDIESGNRAGAITVFLSNSGVAASFNIESDFQISRLSELGNIVRLGLPLSSGKFPADLLKLFLDSLEFEDPSILVRPGIGEDNAVVSIDGEEILVLKSDPITFVTENLGYYTVLINANDIATSGARPRWLLTTLLFPPGVTPSMVFTVMNELKRACQQFGIMLCGGHTEITDSVNRPIVTGMLAGTADKKSLIDKKRIKKGDRVLLTKGVAVEGTAIIAGELTEKLENLGLSQMTIESAKRFRENISILEEAGIAAAHEGVTAMHDVTEGGIAMAVYELSVASGCKIEIDMDKISIFPETEEICQLLDLNPFGLIGSGALLICCKPVSFEGLIKKIKNAGIEIAVIGEVAESGEGVEALKNSRKTSWPVFESDEIARLF